MNTNFVSRYQVNFRRNDGVGLLEDAGEQYRDPHSAAAVCKRVYETEGVAVGYCEHCYALLFDRAAHLTGYVKVSEGGLAATIIDCRKVVKAALDANASTVILVHNHPSNNPRPSSSDRKETERVKDCLKLFDISLTDHIIISEDSFFSFVDDRVNPF